MSGEDASLVPLRGPEPGGALALLSPLGIVPVASPAPELVDGFLRLASHILMRARREPLGSIGVASALRGEGKTTAALNLAICLGRHQGNPGRVLLVDGDRRSRSLTRLVAGGDASKLELDPALVLSPFPGVDLMTAPVRRDALSLHDPHAWAHALRALKARYRFLVVDCPAVLSSPEGLVLPSCVDELVLVVAANSTTRDAVARTLELVAKRPLGVVLNSGAPRNGHA